MQLNELKVKLKPKRRLLRIKVHLKSLASIVINRLKVKIIEDLKGKPVDYVKKWATDIVSLPQLAAFCVLITSEGVVTETLYSIRN